MPADNLAMSLIPEEKQSAVKRALISTFGVDRFEDISKPAGGLSPALVFRIVIGGKPYALRIIIRTHYVKALDHQFECMTIAANGGIAPRILYQSTEDWITITDFIERKPLPADAAQQIARTIRKVHALPRFAQTVKYREAMEGFIHKFRSGNILPERATGDLFPLYEKIAAVYPRSDADHVASHNDLKPGNILYDGKQIWLVDWEAAFLNDPYLDLACAANFFVVNQSDEESFLTAYFREHPGEYQRARFFLMQQALHVYFFTFLMVIVAASGEKIDPDMSAPGFRDFHVRMSADESILATAEGKLKYAKVHLNEALQQMHSKRFVEALAIVERTSH